MPGYLVVADLHLTDRPLDEYRWAVFDFILAAARTYRAQAVVLAGDVTDAKDRHSARFVHRAIKQVRRLEELMHVVWVKGNHDYRDPAAPFFQFIDSPCLRYISDPCVETVAGERVLCIPHTKKWAPAESWRQKFLRRDEYDGVIAHQTFNGARASNGESMRGPALSAVSERVLGAPVIAGDIHVPQRLGNVTYVGSPHSINFGDHFRPRILHVAAGGVTSIPNESVLTRWKLKITPDSFDTDWLSEVYEGDQVKVDITLTAAQALDVQMHRERIRSEVEAVGCLLAGTGIKVRQSPARRSRLFAVPRGRKGAATPEAVLAQFVAVRGIEPELARAMEGML